MKKKRMLSYLLITLAIVVAAMLIFLIISTITTYRPEPQEVLHSKMQPQLCLPKQINITSWNIGYCGLGKDADFFYDGGKMVRPAKKEIEKNLQDIEKFLQARPDDFIMLQEVDIDSKRSYHLNELRSITDKLSEHKHIFALNYKIWYVPIPVLRALGGVKSGIAVLGRCTPYHAVRYAYPVREAWPEHLFQLKRCFMVCRYTAPNGKDLVLINTHNSAYDDGKFRSAEMKMLRDFVMKEYEAGNYVIVGGDWNQTPPGYAKKASTPQYTPQPIAKDLMPQDWQWICDKSTPSVRFTNQPYTEGKTLTSVVDFFLISPNVKTLEVTTHNLGFEHSDHNPITAKFELKE